MIYKILRVVRSVSPLHVLLYSCLSAVVVFALLRLEQKSSIGAGFLDRWGLRIMEPSPNARSINIWENFTNPETEVAKLESDPANYEFDWSNWVLEPEEVLSPNDALHGVDDILGVRGFSRKSMRAQAAYLRRNVISYPHQIILMPQAHSVGYVGSPRVYKLNIKNKARQHLQFMATDAIDQMVGFEEDFVSRTIMDNVTLEIPHEDFVWSTQVEIEKYPAHIAEEMKRILDLTRSPKYFFEPLTEYDYRSVCRHIDLRFFQTIQTPGETNVAIESLVRAWSVFADSFKIKYWWAHGSLLGWHWNGMALPWDIDGDLQVPIKTMEMLAKHFNGTLIVQHPAIGNRSYYLDVNPYYYIRHPAGQRTDNHNRVDARFIDIHTGSYIDITGVANATRYQRNILSCKGGHLMKYEDITPLTLTKFEGGNGYVPSNYKAILKSEYTDAFFPAYGSFDFNLDTMLWQVGRRYKCPFPGSAYSKEQCFKGEPVLDPKNPDAEPFDSYVLEEYTTSHVYTDSHVFELNKHRFLDEEHGRISIMKLLDHNYPSLHRLGSEIPV